METFIHTYNKYTLMTTHPHHSNSAQTLPEGFPSNFRSFKKNPLGPIRAVVTYTGVWSHTPQRTNSPAASASYSQ